MINHKHLDWNKFSNMLIDPNMTHSIDTSRYILHTFVVFSNYDPKEKHLIAAVSLNLNKPELDIDRFMGLFGILINMNTLLVTIRPDN